MNNEFDAQLKAVAAQFRAAAGHDPATTASPAAAPGLTQGVDAAHTAATGLGLVLGNRTAEAQDVFRGLIRDHGAQGVTLAVAYLTEATLTALRHPACTGHITLSADPNLPAGPAARHAVEHVLTGALTNTEARLGTGLAALRDDPATALAALMTLAGYAAARIEAVQDVAGQAVDALFAYDQARDHGGGVR